MLRKILIGLLVVLVVIQFIRPKKNDSKDFSKDITTAYSVPADVQLILQKACYDCHSNSTAYPWYNNIQPVMWWMQHHVNEGKGHLNFSEFADYNFKKQAHKLEEVAEQVEHKEMPLSSYTWMHGEAKLTAEEQQTLITWAKLLQNRIEASQTISHN